MNGLCHPGPLCSTSPEGLRELRNSGNENQGRTEAVLPPEALEVENEIANVDGFWSKICGV